MKSFEIRPNNSLSQRGLMGGAIALGVVLGLFAIRMASMGFWPMLPFLFIDFIAVAWAFYLIRKRCCIYESIEIDAQQLRIHHHEQRKNNSWAFDLQWVRIELQEHSHPWQPSRLLLGSHGKWIEFAQFLTNEERSNLSSALKRTISQKKQYAH